jgi:hypothetical protein
LAHSFKDMEAKLNDLKLKSKILDWR